MGISGLTIIKITSTICAGVFLILGALFSFLEILQDGNNDNVRKWFKKKWIIIRESRILGLPEKVIVWTLNIRSFLQKWINKGVDWITGCMDVRILLPAILSLWMIIGIWTLYRNVKVCLYLSGTSLFVVSWLLFLDNLYKIPWMTKRGIGNQFTTAMLTIVFVLFNFISVVENGQTRYN